MGAAIVLGVVFVFLVVILAGLLRGIDREELRRASSGPASLAGLRAIVGGGFLVGIAYGLLVGGQSGVETWRWLSRGVVDGLVVACAGAFYVGYQQRKRLRGRSGPGPAAGADTGTAGASEADPDGGEDLLGPTGSPPASSRPPASSPDETPPGEDEGGGERAT